MNIVFMGTPDFAAVCLESIIQRTQCAGLLLPQIDKRRGRLVNSKKGYDRHGIPLAQPEKLKAKEFRRC